MTDLGYIRISTGQQTLDQQREALIKAGISPDHVFEDTISGVKSKRPGLDGLLAYSRPGDTVTVLRLDRLGRSTPHILATVTDLTARGIVLRSLREGIDLTTAAGRFQLVVFAAMAAMERELMLERQLEARASVIAKGGRWGRQPALTPEQVTMAIDLWKLGQSATNIAATLGCSKETVYKYTASARHAS